MADTPTLMVAVPVALAIFFAPRLWGRFSRSRTRSKPNPLTPIGFERYCAAILRRHGWRAELTPASGDQGVDILARKRNVSVVFQCKLHSRAVGNGAVQQAIAGRQYMGATHAAVVSNQPYTRAAQLLAERDNVALLAPCDLEEADEIFGVHAGWLARLAGAD